jgi:hypothetical protein
MITTLGVVAGVIGTLIVETIVGFIFLVGRMEGEEETRADIQEN